MISVQEASDRILKWFSVLPAEDIGLDKARGRVLAKNIISRRTQPPVDLSAMDGYAVRTEDCTNIPIKLRCIGEAPAGSSFNGTIGFNEAVRIFTGGPIPLGADAVVLQEDSVAINETVAINEKPNLGQYIRKAGLDFKAGKDKILAGCSLSVRDIGLAAAMNHPWVSVRRRPRISILATGDEIVRPGEPLGESQIVSSNSISLKTFVEICGGVGINLGIANDDTTSIEAMLAGASGSDLLITTGGISVGDYDLVRQALVSKGLEVDFWKVAMRPGKPVMFGTLGSVPVLGLPGNPVSAMVCSLIFVRPIIEKLLGLVRQVEDEATATLSTPLPPNDLRQDYLRAKLHFAPDGVLTVTAFQKQDSSMVSLLASSDCLIVREPYAPAALTGDKVAILVFPKGMERF
jgi:molybdopterin molybdotransferase